MSTLAARRICLLLVVGLCCAFPPHARAQYAGSSAITHWNGQCGGSTREWWDDMCMAWRKKMGDKGWILWWRNFHLVQGPRYVDPDERSWGIDNGGNGMDWNDAGLICTHGGWGSGPARCGSAERTGAGSASFSCPPATASGTASARSGSMRRVASMWSRGSTA